MVIRKYIDKQLLCVYPINRRWNMKQFKLIPSDPRYEISIDGTVRHVMSQRIKSQYISSTGYYMISTTTAKHRRPRRVHRLLAEAYIPNPDNLPQINHKNGIKTDNSLSNLEWCTNLENQRHAFRTGLANNTGEHNGQSKLTVVQVLEIKERLAKGWSQYRISRYYPVSRSAIEGIKTGRLWKHVQKAQTARSI